MMRAILIDKVYNFFCATGFGLTFVLFLNPFIAGALNQSSGPSVGRIQVDFLIFEDGRFIQSVYNPEGSVVLDWTALIYRNGEVYCSGSGQAPYEPFEVSSWSPDSWTDDDCSDLEIGKVYTAEAGWVQQLSGGEIYHVTAQISFTYNG